MIIISLNRTLSISRFTDNSNQTKLEQTFKLIPEDGKILELFNKFETIWKEQIWNLIQNQTTIEIVFIIGSQAGFTDSRIISIWLNSLNLFCPNQEIKIAKYLEYHQNPDSDEYLAQHIENIIKSANWNKTIDSAIYTREPTVHLKN